jgi:hypothetical protein
MGVCVLYEDEVEFIRLIDLDFGFIIFTRSCVQVVFLDED